MKYIFKLLFLFFLALKISAQEGAKPDIVVKVNGEELKGKVVEMKEDEIRFSYSGETLVYVVKKSDIVKIIFASGRVEEFNKSTPPAQNVSNKPNDEAVAPADRRNKVAILPFGFIQDGQNTAHEISTLAQHECYTTLSKHAGIYTIIEPRTSNAILTKAGITRENIDQYTMDELCNKLGAEFIVEGIVVVTTTSTSNYQSNQYQGKTTNDNKSPNQKVNVSSSSSSTSMQNFATTLNLNIYNDKGNSIYSQERKSILNSSDAYKATLDYLLKRTPLYHK